MNNNSAIQECDPEMNTGQALALRLNVSMKKEP